MNWDHQVPDWDNPGAEPPQAKKEQGWQPEEKPPADWWNWFKNRISAAVREIREKISAAATPNTIAARDEQGRLKAAAPAANDDVATKDYTDAGDAAVTDYVNQAVGSVSTDPTVTPDQTQVPASPGTGRVSQVLSWFANRIRAVTGENNWWTNPVRSLRQLHEQKLAKDGSEAMSGQLRINGNAVYPVLDMNRFNNGSDLAEYPQGISILPVGVENGVGFPSYGTALTVKHLATRAYQTLYAHLTDRAWHRTYYDGMGWTPWREVFHTGNLDPSQYAMRTGSSMTGPLSFNYQNRSPAVDPAVATFYNSASVATGAIVFLLPDSLTDTNTMIEFTIQGYNHQSGNTILYTLASGYLANSTGNVSNVNAVHLGSRQPDIRMGRDTQTGRWAVIIGKSDDVWGYPAVTLSMQRSWTGYNRNVLSGWDTLLLTDVPSRFPQLWTASNITPAVQRSGDTINGHLAVNGPLTVGGNHGVHAPVSGFVESSTPSDYPLGQTVQPVYSANNAGFPSSLGTLLTFKTAGDRVVQYFAVAGASANELYWRIASSSATWKPWQRTTTSDDWV